MMGRFRKKVVVPVTLIIVGCLVLATVVFHDSLTSAQANVAFNGINSIVGSHDSKTPFNVIELVPDSEYASIGYLFDKEEPDNWMVKLSNTYDSNSNTGASSRTDYVNNTLKSKLADITETDGSNSRPLHYENYEETYERKDGWKELDLAGYDKLPAGTGGYVMKALGAGNGDYVFQKEYEPVADFKGQYNQNVDHYQYIANPGVGNERGYYTVTFSPITNDGTATNAQRFAGKKAYYPKESYAIVNDASMQEVKAQNPNATLYRISTSNTALPYELVGNISQGGYTFDFNNYTYYTVEFEYVPGDKLSEDKTYYEASAPIFNYDKSGEYGAILDETQPYVPATGGNFKLKDGSNVYLYVGPGKGDYTIVKSDGNSLDYDVMTTKVFYKGGFTNNEWIKYGVFDQENTKVSKDMFFDVITVNPFIINHFDISSVNLLYISGSKSKLSSSGSGKYYTTDNDISWQTAVTIAQRAHLDGINMPVILDSAIFNGNPWSVNSGSLNVQKLAALLCCTNYDDLNINSETDPNSFDWSKLQFKSDSDNHYVNGNIYVIPSTGEWEIPFLFRDFATALTSNTNDENTFMSEAENIGFGEIAQYINDENLIRKKENDANTGTTYKYFDKVISKEIAIEYIISYANRRGKAIDESMDILDIEPFKADKNTPGVMTYSKLKQWIGDTNCPPEDKVNITYVTSSEFVGRIEDLNKYDMIYLGLSTGSVVNKDANGKTVYNDKKMDGLIYSNVGDVLVIPPVMDNNPHHGLLLNDYASDYNNVTLTPRDDDNYDSGLYTYRYSGNDISKENVEKLKDYIKAGFPVVVSDGFYSWGYDSRVNEDCIDNCSNMFTFIRDTKDRDNVLTNSEYAPENKKVTNGTLLSYLNTGKPEILLGYQDIEKDQVYVKLDSNEISLEFSINNTGGADTAAKFDVELLLDANADGKFSDTQEVIDSNDIKLYNNGKLVSPILNTDGSYSYELFAGTVNSYKLSYELPEGYVGVIPWKLKVSQSLNKYRYDSETGYFYVKNKNQEKVKIKILQINTSRLYQGNNSTTLDLQSQYEMEPKSKFRELCDGLEDYELDITTITSDVYAEKYKEQNNYLDSYDMIILGFGDMYTITDTNECFKGIQKYIDDGKPVLFTHDTTSFFNINVGWGYDFNTKVRDLVGMDRYGILNNDALKSGNTLYQGSSEYNAAVDYATKNNTDIAYVPKSNRTQICRQNQGFAYMDLNRYQTLDTTYYKYDYLFGVSHKTNQQEMNVSKVNSGQITSYPFIIKDTFWISKTHTQYYQLDMNQDSDDDGESDIVVWYTLEGNLGYDLSPKDVRNNYYIYTMGNVTYSGVGHSSIEGNDEELKLYINTMIAAYGAATRAPKINLKETAEENSPQLGVIYSSIDDAIAASDPNANANVDGENAMKEAYFSLKNTNLVRNTKSTVCYAEFYLPVSETEYNENKHNPEYRTISEEGSTVYLKKQDWKISAPDENSSYNIVSTPGLQSGITYKVDVPLSALPKDKSSIKVYCVAYSKIVKYSNSGGEGAVVESPYSYETFQIQRVGLTDLD